MHTHRWQKIVSVANNKCHKWQLTRIANQKDRNTLHIECFGDSFTLSLSLQPPHALVVFVPRCHKNMKTACATEHMNVVVSQAATDNAFILSMRMQSENFNFWPHPSYFRWKSKKRLIRQNRKRLPNALKPMPGKCEYKVYACDISKATVVFFFKWSHFFYSNTLKQYFSLYSRLVHLIRAYNEYKCDWWWWCCKWNQTTPMELLQFSMHFYGSNRFSVVNLGFDIHTTVANRLVYFLCLHECETHKMKMNFPFMNMG